MRSDEMHPKNTVIIYYIPHNSKTINTVWLQWLLALSTDILKTKWIFSKIEFMDLITFYNGHIFTYLSKLKGLELYLIFIVIHLMSNSSLFMSIFIFIFIFLPSFLGVMRGWMRGWMRGCIRFSIQTIFHEQNEQ